VVTDIIIFQVYLVVSNKNLEIAASIIYSPGDEDDNDDDTLPDTHPVSIKALKTDSFFHSFIHSLQLPQHTTVYVDNVESEALYLT